MVLVKPETIAEYTEKGWWGQQTLWDVFVQQVSARGDAEAVVDACNRSDFAHGAAAPPELAPAGCRRLTASACCCCTRA